MKRNAFEALSFSENNNSKILLTNCGFPLDFFNKFENNILIIQNSIKKTKSENDIISLQKKEEEFNQKKIYEAEDKEFYNKNSDNFKKDIYINSNFNSSNYNISSCTTFHSPEYLFKDNNSEIIKKNNNYIIKAYKSKLKKKYSKFYEINSNSLKEKNKYKLYHKCCYPGCNRTFSSSGWLKAHLKYHLKQIHNSKYCKLFDNYILNEKIKKYSKQNNLLNYKKNNVNIINNNIINNYQSKNINIFNSFFDTEFNFPKPPKTFFNNENNTNLNDNNNYLNLNVFINPIYKKNF